MPMVTFLGDVRKVAGRSRVDVQAETVGQLLAAIGEAIGPGFARVLSTGVTLQPDVEVLVNGRNIEFLKMLETPLHPTDQITIFYSGVRGFPGG
jgi:molybdopterin converting factor small subunit